MAIVYYYVSKERLDVVLRNGIDVEVLADKRLLLGDENSPCIMCLLSPKDDTVRYKSQEYACIEIDVDIKDCFVVDSDLDAANDTNLYVQSILPLSKYKFGTYRRPEVAIRSKIPPEKIAVFKKRMGSPLLFETSDKLYKSNILEDLRLKYSDFDETILGIFFMMMVSKGRMKLLGQKSSDGKTVYIYQDVSNNKIHTLDIKEGK